MYDEKFFKNLEKIESLYAEGKTDSAIDLILNLLNVFEWYERETGKHLGFDNFLSEFLNKKKEDENG